MFLTTWVVALNPSSVITRRSIHSNPAQTDPDRCRAPRALRCRVHVRSAPTALLGLALAQKPPQTHPHHPHSRAIALLCHSRLHLRLYRLVDGLLSDGIFTIRATVRCCRRLANRREAGRLRHVVLTLQPGQRGFDLRRAEAARGQPRRETPASHERRRVAAGGMWCSSCGPCGWSRRPQACGGGRGDGCRL